MKKNQSINFVIVLITALLFFVSYASADEKKVPFQGLICQEGATWIGERVQLPDSTWTFERQAYYNISDCNDLIDGYMTIDEKWEGELLPGSNPPPDGPIGPKNAIVKGSIVIVPDRLCTLREEVKIVGPPFAIRTLEHCCIEALGTWVGKFYQKANNTDLYPEHGPMIDIVVARGTGFLEGLTLKAYNIFGAGGGYMCISNDDRKFTGYIKYKKGKKKHHNNDED